MRNENQIMKLLPFFPGSTSLLNSLELAGIASLGHGGSFSQKQPLKSPITKTCPPKPNAQKHSGTKTKSLIKVSDD